MAAAMASSSRKRMAVDGLPSDCWELVISKLLNEIDIDNVEERKYYLETLSLVSKQLLSITNTFVYSFKLINPSSSLTISRIFNRFPNLTSLDLSTNYRGRADLNALISRIPPRSFSRLKSLNLSNNPIIPTLGLRSIILKNNNTSSLTSLICSNIASLIFTDITFIADSFPFLQHLDISFPGGREGISDHHHPQEDKDYNNALNLLAQKLSQLRSIHLSANFYVKDSWFLQLCINCEFLQEVVISQCPFITHENPYFIHSLTSLKRLTCIDLSFSCITNLLLKSIARARLPLTKLVLQGCYNYTYYGIHCLLSKCPSLQHLDLQGANFLNNKLFNKLCLFLAGLVSINVSGCQGLGNSSFFALLSNCPLLAEIRMESTNIGIGPPPSVVDLAVYHQLKSLHLACSTHLQDEQVNTFGFMFPSMQLIDLSFCKRISDQCIATLLKRCRKIRHLKLACCFPLVKVFSINFEVCGLEVLNLSHLRIDDKELYEISKIFPRLLQLDLEHCYDVTEKGVRLAVENCTRLKEINLQYCHKVSTDIVSWMIFSRPSLRKITAPPHFRLRDCDRKLLSQRCLIL
ncbi:F-box/LRR-repeat protein [Trifolium repens]|nr:F-box/LRR-repeat protein [Trifolium repens]